MDTIVAVTLEELAVARDEVEASSGRAAARPRLVLVTGAKAGEGATSVAVNLAAAATRAGAKVVLVEADPILGDLTLMLGLPAATDTLVTHPPTGIRVQVLPPGRGPVRAGRLPGADRGAGRAADGAHPRRPGRPDRPGCPGRRSCVGPASRVWPIGC